MSMQENKTLVRQYYEEMWNRWDFTLADKLLADDLTFRGSLGTTCRGRAEFQKYMRAIHAAFPDFYNRIDDLVTEGDTVVARLTYSGTHQCELFGIAATGRRVSYVGVAIFRLAAGRIAEAWVLGDVHGLIQQLRNNEN